MKNIRTSWLPLLIGLIFLLAILYEIFSRRTAQPENEIPEIKNSFVPDINSVPHTPEGDMIRYGRELIANTSKYLGPRGIVAQITNGMNCQNCHLEAGTRVPVNSFLTVASSYPKFRNRSGRVESIEFRINDCLQRSLNGKTIDSLSKEMKAMKAYLKWLGKDVKSNEKIIKDHIDLLFLNRAADTLKGKRIFLDKCQRCHQSNGQGEWNIDSTEYLYPPLWGTHSYNTSAGMYRISTLANFIKNYMPFDLAAGSPQLSDEDAWDVAAFICSQYRPLKIFAEDWPTLEYKPIDFPFGPYTDAFTQLQHKYGPFPPIKEAHAAASKKKRNSK